MPKTATYEISTQEADQWKNKIGELTEQMQEANRRMDTRQIEIERLKSHTRITLDQIRKFKV